ncbi:unnamed protein product [Lactuca saligna]|uniref:Uncharacterized protein n=1 Tax=Lactuca saligna TaxID=75948 RepID=A0AA35ZFD0_LACSI|nr:unnamed protein product [Lactuca saligna]
MIKGPYAPNSTINIQSTNVAFSDEIPTSLQTQESKTLSASSRAALFDMHYVISQTLSTLNKKYLTGVISKCIHHKTRSLDQLNLFEQRILYSIVYNKKLEFAQLFLDQMVNCITGNKKPLNVPYPHWLGLILSRK